MTLDDRCNECDDTLDVKRKDSDTSQDGWMDGSIIHGRRFQIAILEFIRSWLQASTPNAILRASEGFLMLDVHSGLPSRDVLARSGWTLMCASHAQRPGRRNATSLERESPTK